MRKMMLITGIATALALPAVAAPPGVSTRDGGLVDPSGKPLYVWENDTMVGMSHCWGGCAEVWPPFVAVKGGKASGDWSLIRREDGALQWALKNRPLYTFAQDKPGEPAAGTANPGWTRAQ